MIEVPVSSLVTDASTVDPETSAMEAAGYLRQPDEPALVVRDGGEVVGVVTESDIVAVVAEGGTNPRVASFMSSPVVTIPPSTQVGLAADRMRDAGVGLLPVVEADGTYRGVVTKAALAPYLSRHRLEITWDSEPLTLGGSDGAESVEVTDPESSDARVPE